MVTAIAVLVAVVVAAAITWPCAIGYRKKVVETKLGNAELWSGYFTGNRTFRTVSAGNHSGSCIQCMA